MKINFRIIALLCALCFCFAALAGCNKSETPAGEGSEAPESVEQENNISEVIIVRPQSVSNDLRDLMVNARDHLKENTGLSVKLTTDHEAYEAKEGRYYILLGKTEYELSKTLASETADGEIRYKTSEDTVAVYAKDDKHFYIAVEKLFGDCVEDGVFAVGKGFADLKINASEFTKEGWSFNFPAYTYGELDDKTYSAGYGLELDKNCSYMHVAAKTSPEDFEKYLSLLEKMGYDKEFYNEIDGNLYASYTGALGSNIYAYFMLESGKVRIIDDRASVKLSEFNYTLDASQSSRFYMFRMNTESEDTFLIHLADNSWIVIDGGTTQYNDIDTDGVFVDRLYNFMAERSGLSDGEKLKISCWYMTHAHRDHLLGFKGLIDRYHKNIELSRVLANTPDGEVVYNSNNPSYVECVDLINKYYPDVLYLKAHTGMTVQLADAKLEVLYTQEDNIENWCGDRDLNYKIYDYNNSSLMTKITVAGVSVLELGDGFCAQFLLKPSYNINTLAADILKVAHHYYNPESDDFYKALYETGKVEYALVNHFTNPGGTTGKNVKPLFADKFINGSADKTYEFYRENGNIVMNVITHAD